MHRKEKFAFSTFEGYLFLGIEEITRFKADNKNVLLNSLKRNEAIVLMPMNEIEELLIPTNAFFRPHRSHLVNLMHILKNYFTQIKFKLSSPLLLIGLIIILFSNCKTNNPGEISSKIKNLPKPIEVEPILNKEYFSSIQAIPLETTLQSQIGRIDKLIIEQDRIFVLDSHQKVLLIFDIDGNFVNKINSIGKGPGEYQVLHDFWLDTSTKTIEILDRGKILSYTYDGAFVNEFAIDVPASNLAKTNTGNYYVWTGSQTDNVKNGTLNFLNDNGKLEKRYFNWDRNGKLVSQQNMFTLSDSGILFRPFRFDYIIRELTDQGITEKYFVNFENTLSKQDYLINLINRGNLNGVLENGEFINFKDCAFYIAEIFETKDYISFNYITGGRSTLQSYLYSKEENKAVTCAQTSIKSLLPQSIILFDYADIKTNTFYTSYDAYLILSFYNERLDEMKGSKELDNVVTIINTLTPNSNPIIFQLKINDAIFNNH